MNFFKVSNNDINDDDVKLLIIMYLEHAKEVDLRN